MARGNWFIRSSTYRGKYVSQSGPFKSEQEAEDALHDLVEAGIYNVDHFCYSVVEK